MIETKVLEMESFETLDDSNLEEICGGTMFVDFVGAYVLGKVLDWAFKPIDCY